MKHVMRELFHRYLAYSKLRATYNDSTFPGVDCQDLIELEKCFDISIVILELGENGTTESVWASERHGSASRLYLNLHDNHFSLIKKH